MPIKPENRHKYPSNWKDLREAVLKRAHHRCELCFVPNGAIIQRDETGIWRHAIESSGTRIVLTTAHINQDIADNRMVNLLALCQRCHLRIDAPYRKSKVTQPVTQGVTP